MVKVQEHNNRLFVTMPKRIAKIKGWTKGTDLDFNIDVKTGLVQVQKVEDMKE